MKEFAAVAIIAIVSAMVTGFVVFIFLSQPDLILAFAGFVFLILLGSGLHWAWQVLDEWWYKRKY